MLQQKRAPNVKGGQNKETFMMTVKTFKLLCLKSGTEKSNKIHEYYVNLEEVLQEIINEETTELKNQLQNVLVSNEKEKEILKDIKISAPALRQRILTKVHIDDYHWVFDKNSSHYN